MNNEELLAGLREITRWLSRIAACAPVSQPLAAEMGADSPATPDEHTGPHGERASAWFQQHGDPT